MRKAIVYIFLPFFYILILTACKSKPVGLAVQPEWESTDPLSIPMQVRENEFNKKNLILNPSFENGRYYMIDSTKVSFILPAWEKVGDNVYWTDVQMEKEYGPSEAYHGLHAIKIVRKKADETDNQGEGVLSDFIKVIPGNYRLAYHIKLEHVGPQVPRMVKNLADAINIRILCYDRNKVMIKSSVYNPVDNNMIDNSFKGFSFSALKYVDELGWGKALGKTANYPFDEGDMPDKTHYVRIFFGLKGNGTIWIDRVNFEYSVNNFSLLERTEALFDSEGSPASDLIPAPRQISGYSPEALMIQGNDRLIDPVILVPLNAGKDIMRIAEKISFQLGSALKGKNKKPVAIRIINKLDPGMIGSGRLIFSLGKTQVFKMHADQLPVKNIKGREQAYLINMIPSMKRLIFIEANDNQGFDYAFNTILQLIDTEDKIYHHHDIIDYPDILTRAVILPFQQGENSQKLTSRVGELAAVGCNLVYFQMEDVTGFSADNMKKIQAFTVLLSKIKSSFPGVEFGISLLNIRFQKPSGVDEVYISFKKQSENLMKLIKGYLNAGYGKLLITDEFIWDYLDMGSKSVSFDYLAPEAFEDFIRLTDHFLQDIRVQMKGSPVKKSILFLPVLSTNENVTDSKGYASVYFRELQKYIDLVEGILWKGPAELPARIDFAESRYFQSESRLKNFLFINNLTTRKDSRLQGNFSSLCPGRAGMGNIFEGLDIDIGATPAEMNLPSFYLVNQPDNSVISRIRVLTAADYMWNSGNYKPSESSWKALLKLYGRSRAVELIRFNESYNQLLQLCMMLEEEKSNQRNYKAAEKNIIELNAHWSKITKSFGTELELLNELSDIKNQVITRLYQIK